MYTIKDEKVNSHTYQLHKEKQFCVVIRNVHPLYATHKEELKQHSSIVINVLK